MKLSPRERALILKWAHDSDVLRGGGAPEDYEQTPEEKALINKIKENK